MNNRLVASTAAAGILCTKIDLRHLPVLRMKSLSLLYVEDNDDLREIFQEMLEAENREIVACANGEDALAVWESRHFDIVLTDISLPGMSGTDLARRLLEMQPNAWIVLCSGYHYPHGLSSLGPNVRSLPKPFELEELDTLMQEIGAALHKS
jgi:two-component system cell cycle response regulator CpdR